MKRSYFLVPGAAAACTLSLILSTGCGSAQGAKSAGTPRPTTAATVAGSRHGHSRPTKVVKIITLSSGKFAFSPSSITVKPGTEVIWKNNTGTDHTVTTSRSSFSISDIPPSTKAHLIFKKVGVFKYHCSFHPYMHGKVTVKH